MHSMIVYTNFDKSEVYYKSDEFESIQSIHIIPIYVNGIPLIITDSSKPETDFSWNSLLSFDGEKFIVHDKNKIKIGDKE